MRFWREKRRRAGGPVQDWYAEARLRPIDTGLPMTIWVSERGNERHDVRVKVCRVHGLALQWNNAAGIAVRPQPHVAAGHLAPGDFDAVSRWIVLNEAVLVAYWEGTIGTVELVQRLRPLSPAVLP
jgi:hypothetical protein